MRPPVPTAPADLALWRWLIERGPHGTSFTWSPTRSGPPGYVGIEHLQQVIAERAGHEPDFPARIRDIAHMALAASEAEILRRAIQVAAVVGGDRELRVIATLVDHPEPTVAADARAGRFFLRQNLRRQPPDG